MSHPVIHPGRVLAGELKALGVTPTELARQIGVPPNRISQIIRGKRGITGNTALRLGHWFGTSAESWLSLQMAYEIHAAEIAIGAKVGQMPTKTSAPGAPDI
ncbi:MAG: XRE family plasmid maintenance system antidote protein [Rhodospirillaceae bacterium]|nr:MAG: XRE family plasmid maintenance system antidote protein [Rhodospirillaceae bacterium]